MRAEQVVRKVIGSAHEATKEAGNRSPSDFHHKFYRGGGPRFWFSISPEATQTNYAQVIVQVRDKEAELWRQR